MMNSYNEDVFCQYAFTAYMDNGSKETVLRYALNMYEEQQTQVMGSTNSKGPKAEEMALLILIH